MCEVAFVVEVPQLPIHVRVQHVVEGEDAVEAGVATIAALVAWRSSYLNPLMAFITVWANAGSAFVATCRAHCRDSHPILHPTAK